METFKFRKWPNHHCRCDCCGLLLLVMPVVSFLTSPPDETHLRKCFPITHKIEPINRADEERKGVTC
jgi:hypothetical protein